MEAIAYLFSPKGKIERIPFLGLLIVSFVLGIFVSFILEYVLGELLVVFLIQSWVLLYVSYCIYMKRFNDIGGMHVWVQAHFALLATAILCSVVDFLLTPMLVLFVLNLLFGLFLLAYGLLKQGTKPFTIRHGGESYTFTTDMLTKVKKSFIPNFETTGMLVSIGGGYELILTKDQYEERQKVREYADKLYVFHLNKLE